MSKHARQRNVGRNLLLAALAVVARLRDVRRPARHQRAETVSCRPGLAAQAVVAARWAARSDLAMRRLRELIDRVTAGATHLGWPVLQLAAATAIALPVVLVPDAVTVGDPAATRTVDVAALRNDYAGFVRGLVGEPSGGQAAIAAGERPQAVEDDGGEANAQPAADPGGDPASGGEDPGQPSQPELRLRISPYLFLGGSKIPDAGMVMTRTGITSFTLAFVLSDGGCAPAWGGYRPLSGDAAGVVRQIQAAGGEVVVSFGGWSGHKLGEHCATPGALAAAYQRVIDAYGLRAIDVDIEASELTDPAAQDRVLRALGMVEAANPGLTTIVTMPVTADGLNSWGLRMVRRAVELRVPVDVWTIMPFVLGLPGADMGRLTIRAAEHTHDQLARYHPDAYRMLGISSMNGDTGAGETVTQADFREIRDYVHRHGLARFTFWAVNRDRPCLDRGFQPCSGVPQTPWQFTDILNGIPPNP